MEIGEVIVEVIGEIVLPFFWRILVVFPGAVLRFFIFMFKKQPKSFDYYFNKTSTSSGFLGLGCYALLLIVVLNS